MQRLNKRSFDDGACGRVYALQSAEGNALCDLPASGAPKKEEKTCPLFQTKCAHERCAFTGMQCTVIGFGSGATKLFTYYRGIREAEKDISDKAMIVNGTCWKIVLDCDKWNIKWFEIDVLRDELPSEDGPYFLERLVAETDIVKGLEYHPFVAGIFSIGSYAKYHAFFEERQFSSI